MYTYQVLLHEFQKMNIIFVKSKILKEIKYAKLNVIIKNYIVTCQ